MSSRREWVKQASGVTLGAMVAPASIESHPTFAMSSEHRGRIRQSVSRWCYQSIPLPQLCRDAKRIGLVGIDLLQRADWDIVSDAGLTCTMGYAADRRDFLGNGFTNRESHAMLLKELETAIPLARRKNVPNVIAMFGNRAGRSDVEAINAAIEGLRKIAPLAEQEGVTICVELLNSKVDHKDYHGDRTQFGVDVMKGVGSSRVKLLYDIYHMQIMEGDVIRTIKANKDYIGHYHTGGVPGRHELDHTQELNWPAVMRAIADTGYTGYVAHEFIPTKPDAMVSLQEAFTLCDIA
jgi:hydroxypyruvate isomerase